MADAHADRLLAGPVRDAGGHRPCTRIRRGLSTLRTAAFFRVVLKPERAAVRGLIVFDNPQVGRRHASVAAGMSTDKVNLQSCMLIVPAPKRGERRFGHAGSRMVTVAENDQPHRACPRTQRREPVQVAVRRSHWQRNGTSL